MCEDQVLWKNIAKDVWLDAISECEAALLAGRSSNSVAPGASVAKSYFIHSKIARISLKACLRLARHLAGVDHAEPIPQSKDVFVHAKKIGLDAVYEPGSQEGIFALPQLDASWPVSTSAAPSIRLTLSRPDQQVFRNKLVSIYKCCLVSKCAATAVLEAAHVLPYSAGGSSCINNGILLRADLHRLFDSGLLSLNVDSGMWEFAKSVEIDYREIKKECCWGEHQPSKELRAELRRHWKRFKQSAY